MQLILPKTYVNPENIHGPLFFLAGPIKGGNDWQRRAFYRLSTHLDFYYVVNPCRYETGDLIREHSELGTAGKFERQTQWERFYLTQAARQGCIIFWLPCESKTSPRDAGNPYARDTYGEIGEWRARLMADPSLKIVVGAEPNFPGLSQIQCNFEECIGKDFKIYCTLDDTIAAAVKKAL